MNAHGQRELNPLTCFYSKFHLSFTSERSTILAPYVAGLNDDKIVQLFLHGDPLLSHETNVDIISMAQSFIEDSKRFNLRILQ